MRTMSVRIAIRSRRRQWVAITLLLIVWLIIGSPNPKIVEASMFPNSVNHVSDPSSNLEGSLTVLRGTDGGAAAIRVELHNPSASQDIVLKVNAEMSAFIMLTVTDQQGVVLSKPAKKFKSSEIQQFITVRIPRGASDCWQAPLMAQLPANQIPEQGMKCRLVVNVALLSSKVDVDGQPADGDFQSSLLTLYDMDLLFTRKALTENAAAATS
jgi:hypothetical protein